MPPIRSRPAARPRLAAGLNALDPLPIRVLCVHTARSRVSLPPLPCLSLRLLLTTPTAFPRHARQPQRRLAEAGMQVAFSALKSGRGRLPGAV
jgi:hypothetical protein